MFARFVDTVSLRVLGSVAFGDVVRAVIVLASREAAARKAVMDGAGRTMIPVR